MIGLAQPRVRLFDLLQCQKITTGTYEFVQIFALPAGAGVPANEGALKTEASVATALKTVTVATIASWAQASRQAISDNASLLSTSNAFGGRVLGKAHDLLVNGAGCADVIRGLLTESLAYAAADGSVADKVSEAAAVMVDAGYAPSAVVLNPLTWYAVRTSKATPGGEYLAGSWNAPTTPSIWNMSVVESHRGPR